MNETAVPDGNNAMTIFYREKSIVDGSVPFEELNFLSIDATKPWEIINMEAEK